MSRYHLRRKDKEVTDHEELVTPLREAKYVIVAVCRDNKPYLATLSHAFDEENNCMYFHSAREGKKIDYIQANPVVWGQALLDKEYQQGSCDHLYHTCQFKGKVTLVEDAQEKRYALELMIRHLDENPEKIIKEQTKPNSISKIHVGRIDILEMTGKKADKIIIAI